MVPFEARPGLTISTSVHGLNQMTHHFLGPYLFAHSRWLSLPDEFKFSHGKIQDVEVLLEEPEDIAEDIKFEIDANNKTIRMNGLHLKAQMRGNYTFTIM